MNRRRTLSAALSVGLVLATACTEAQAVPGTATATSVAEPAAAASATITPAAYPMPASQVPPSAVPGYPPPASATPPGPVPLYSQTSLWLMNNGQVFTYNVTGRFAVFLDMTHYPEDGYVCTPEGIISWVSNATGLYDEATGLYSVGFEGIQPGSCVLRNGDFSVTIIILE